MSEINLLSKRVRRCEVSNLIITEEISEIRTALRAVYEAILVISRRLPDAIGSTPAEVLMNPPWYRNPSSANVLAPPSGLDVQQKGLGVFRANLSRLTPLQLLELKKSQERIIELFEQLKEREKEREKLLKKDSLNGPTR